jgi:hypothetical protein
MIHGTPLHYTSQLIWTVAPQACFMLHLFLLHSMDCVCNNCRSLLYVGVTENDGDFRQTETESACRFLHRSVFASLYLKSRKVKYTISLKEVPYEAIYCAEISFQPSSSEHIKQIVKDAEHQKAWL